MGPGGEPRLCASAQLASYGVVASGSGGPTELLTGVDWPGWYSRSSGSMVSRGA